MGLVSCPCQVSCKVLAVLNMYMSTSNYFWMLCEGIYLHTLIIVAVFVGEQQLFWYYVLGWGEFPHYFLLSFSASIFWSYAYETTTALYTFTVGAEDLEDSRSTETAFKHHTA